VSGGGGSLKELSDVTYNWADVDDEKWDVPHGYLSYWGEKYGGWKYISITDLLYAIANEMSFNKNAADFIWSAFKIRSLSLNKLTLKKYVIGDPSPSIEVAG
jgi:hypothetical protein